MKLLSFREALKKTKQQIEEMMIPVQVKQNRLAGETELAKIEEQIIDAECKLQELTVAHPINYNKILEKIDEIALLERRQGQFKKVMEDLFDDESIQ